MRNDVLNLVRTAVPEILGYDHARLSQDIDEASQFLTPDFASEYQALGEGEIRRTSKRYQAVVVAQVVSAGLEALDAETAQALVFVDQTTRTSMLPVPRVDTSRVRVHLIRTDGEWRVSAIEPF